MLDPEFWRGKSVFLTGHTGFKGAWMTLLLARLGAKVHGFSLAPNTEPSMFQVLAVKDLCESHVIGDIRDQSAICAAAERVRPDVTIHMAAQAIVSVGYSDPVGTFATNVMGTAHFLEATLRSSAELSLVVSSDKCYRNDERGEPFRETDPLGGKDPYSASKAGTEIAVQSWRASYFQKSGIRLASARAGNVIGGGDWSDDRLLPDAARAFGSGQPLLVRNPASVRPWQHVLEPVVGYLYLIQKLAADESFARGWNFGPVPPVGATVGEVVNIAAGAWPGSPHWETPKGLAQQFSEAQTLLLNCDDAVGLLGWTPQLSTLEAVKWTMEWYHAFSVGGTQAGSKVTEEQIGLYLARTKSDVPAGVEPSAAAEL